MANEELRLIVNPTAARGTLGKEWPELRSYLKGQGLNFKDALTEAPGHATELAREALHQGYRTVVAVGGDGTVNEVVNGLVNGNGRIPDASLGIISRGTGCDLVRSLGLHKINLAIQALSAQERMRVIDLGEVITTQDGQPKRRLFVNAAGMGFDGEVIQKMLEKKNAGKAMGGAISYFYQVLSTIWHYKKPTIHAHIDDIELNGVFTSMFACNGQFFGGGMRVAPQADPADSLFDVVVLAKMSRLDLFWRLPTIYPGWHVKMKPVKIYRARKLSVEDTDRPLLIQADGELIGTTPATLQLLPQALRVRF